MRNEPEHGEGSGRPLLGRLWLDLLAGSLSSTLALLPALSIEGSVQIMATSRNFRHFVALEGDQLRRAKLEEPPNGSEVALLAQIVARWEPRPGFVLCAVYTHQRPLRTKRFSARRWRVSH